MSRQRMESRLACLESQQVGVFPHELVTQLAERFDLSEAEIIAEAEHLIRQFAERGATTWEERLRIVANDRGIPLDALRAELEAMGVPVR